MPKTAKILTLILAATSLNACGVGVGLFNSDYLNGEIAKTATKETTQKFVAVTYNGNRLLVKNRDATFAEDLEGTKELHLANRTYKLDFIESLKLEPGGVQVWQKTIPSPFGFNTNEIVTLKNMSTQILEGKYQYKTANVDLWYIVDGTFTEDVSGKQTFSGYDFGYADFGFKTKDMRTSGTKIFEGGYAARHISRADAFDKTDVLGKATFNVDFNTGNPTVSGKVETIVIPDSLNGNLKGGEDLVIYDGKISGTGFDAKIKYKDDNATPITGTLTGRFYGDDAVELGGNGQFTSKTHVTVFGFTGK